MRPVTPAHILLVDDNDADAELVVESFEMQKIHVSLTRARDGLEGLEMLRGQGAYEGAPVDPDLVLLDLNLPRMDGREMLAELKEDPELRKLPVVVLTSSRAETDIIASYDLQAACYVTKPVDLEGLTQIARAIDDFWLTVVRYPRNDPDEA
jgi:chemotaxis family two-component system response regulator Rcp1